MESNKMKKYSAVFLDRDGVLCEEKSYITKIEELNIFSYTKYCIEQLHQKGFLTICVTNQSAVARGMMTEETLCKLNRYLMKEINLDAIYYCPHHPDGIERYRKNCNCRKPNIGMIESAEKDFRIEREISYMVGDRASDIICGQRASLKTVLLESGYGTMNLELPVKPDFIYKNLEEFVEKI